MYKFKQIRTKDTPETQEYIKQRFVYDDGDGRLYSRDPVTNPSSTPTPSLIYEYKGYQPPEKGWAFSYETMVEWDNKGKLYFPANKSQRIRRKTFLDEYEGQPVQNLWGDIYVINSQAREALNYPTQKPEALLERIINTSSDEGDVVFDCFMGSGTTQAVSVALFRSPKSKVFVLQATMRCLRKITDEQLTATVYLSKENMDILDDELKKNFRTSIEELVVKKDKKSKKVPVRVKEPPRTLRMNRLHYKYSLETKHYDSILSFGLKEIEIENYDATMYVKEGLTTSSVMSESNVNYMVSKTAYTEITLVAEVAKYFPDIRCTEVARILRESEEGIDKILVAVNEYNDIIYDKIVPTIFEALYLVNKEIVKENVDVKLLKKPKEGGYYEFSGNEDLIIMQNSEDSVVVKNKDKSFHADTYVFDSKPELQLFLQLLANEHVKKAYFTGMFTADQTDFYVPYIDPESNRLRKYYPDFLVKMDDGSYLILEVKGDNMIDDPVVKAKGAAAEEVAVESSMKYEMLKGTDIMEGKAKF